MPRFLDESVRCCAWKSLNHKGHEGLSLHELLLDQLLVVNFAGGSFGGGFCGYDDFLFL